MNARNFAYDRMILHNTQRDIMRTEYLTWIVHFYGEQMTTIQLLERMQGMTLQSFETLMRLFTYKGEAKKAQEKRAEEERQKKLLEKLKSGQQQLVF